jgi:hypothetical protein
MNGHEEGAKGTRLQRMLLITNKILNIQLQLVLGCVLCIYTNTTYANQFSNTVCIYLDLTLEQDGKATTFICGCNK